MMRKGIIFLLGIIVGAVGLWGYQLRQEAPATVAASGDLEQSLDELADAVREAGVFVREHTWFGSAEEQAEAYRHIVRALTNSLESRALAEPDFSNPGAEPTLVTLGGAYVNPLPCRD